MKKCVNGIVTDMTAEEERKYLEDIASLPSASTEPTIESLQTQITELQEALNLLLSGATE